MLKKFQNFQPQNSRNTVMLKQFQKFEFFWESGLGLDIDARILEFLEFFEHYRVS